MQKNKIVTIVIIALVVIGVSFYGGMKYGQSGSPVRGTGPNGMPTGNFSQRTGQFGTSTVSRENRVLGGMVAGQILSIDGNNLTIKSQDGGSRIVFLSASTTVSKMTTGTVKDLIVGSEVSVSGASNSDNSINAASIQLRPALLK